MPRRDPTPVFDCDSNKSEKQMTVLQVPNVLPVQGKTVYVSFSAEINAHTTESLIAAMTNCANQGAAEVHLLLSTPGGGVMNSVTLYNTLQALPFKLVTYNVGNVDSAGNIIFLAGQDRYACPDSTFMFHGCNANTPPGVTQFSARQLRELLQTLDAEERRTASIIEQRSKLSEAQIQAFFQQAHTMNAAEAVGFGIIDEIREIQIPAGSPIVSLVFKR